MNVLLDTGVWFRRYHGAPQSPSLRSFLENDVEEFHLCSLSIAEIALKWQRGRLPKIPDPSLWVEHSLQNIHLQFPTASTALQAGLWDWPQGDLIDRILAAISAETGLTLVHTDLRLKEHSGFPQRYFPNVSDTKGP